MQLPDQTDRGWCHFSEELVFRVTQGSYRIIIRIGGKDVCRVSARRAWAGSTRSDWFVEEIKVVDMLDCSVTDQFGDQCYDKGVLIIDFLDEGRLRTFRSNG